MKKKQKQISESLLKDFIKDTLICLFDRCFFCTSFLLIFYLICPLLFLCQKTWADTSEFALGSRYGLGNRVNQSVLETNKGNLVTESNQIKAQQDFNLLLGLGLSFTSSVWLSMGFSHAKALMQARSAQSLCLPVDSISNTAVPMTCVREQGWVNLNHFRSSLEYTYKPYDHWSPVFGFNAGMSYRPAQKLKLEVQSQSMGLDQNDDWTSLGLISLYESPAVYSFYQTLFLGLEKRVLSRYGLRLSTWFNIEIKSASSADLQLSYGLSLEVLYYRYVRLL